MREDHLAGPDDSDDPLAGLDSPFRDDVNDRLYRMAGQDHLRRQRDAGPAPVPRMGDADNPLPDAERLGTLEHTDAGELYRNPQGDWVAHNPATEVIRPESGGQLGVYRAGTPTNPVSKTAAFGQSLVPFVSEDVGANASPRAKTFGSLGRHAWNTMMSIPDLLMGSTRQWSEATSQATQGKEPGGGLHGSGVEPPSMLISPLATPVVGVEAAAELARRAVKPGVSEPIGVAPPRLGAKAEPDAQPAIYGEKAVAKREGPAAFYEANPVSETSQAYQTVRQAAKDAGLNLGEPPGGPTVPVRSVRDAALPQEYMVPPQVREAMVGKAGNDNDYGVVGGTDLNAKAGDKRISTLVSDAVKERPDQIGKSAARKTAEGVYDAGPFEIPPRRFGDPNLKAPRFENDKVSPPLPRLEDGRVDWGESAQSLKYSNAWRDPRNLPGNEPLLPDDVRPTPARDLALQEGRTAYDALSQYSSPAASKESISSFKPRQGESIPDAMNRIRRGIDVGKGLVANAEMERPLRLNADTGNDLAARLAAAQAQLKQALAEKTPARPKLSLKNPPPASRMERRANAPMQQYKDMDPDTLARSIANYFQREGLNPNVKTSPANDTRYIKPDPKFERYRLQRDANDPGRNEYGKYAPVTFRIAEDEHAGNPKPGMIDIASGPQPSTLSTHNARGDRYSDRASGALQNVMDWLTTNKLVPPGTQPRWARYTDEAKTAAEKPQAPDPRQLKLLADAGNKSKLGLMGEQRDNVRPALDRREVATNGKALRGGTNASDRFAAVRNLVKQGHFSPTTLRQQLLMSPEHGHLAMTEESFKSWYRDNRQALGIPSGVSGQAAAQRYAHLETVAQTRARVTFKGGREMKPWLPEDAEALRHVHATQMAAGNATYAGIAKAMGRDPGMIHRKMTEMGLSTGTETHRAGRPPSGRPLTPEERAQANRMAHESAARQEKISQDKGVAKEMEERPEGLSKNLNTRNDRERDDAAAVQRLFDQGKLKLKAEAGSSNDAIRAFHATRSSYRDDYQTRPFSPVSDHGELGPHFGTSEQAHERLRMTKRSGMNDANDNGAILPVDLNLKRSKQIADPGLFTPDALQGQLEREHSLTPEGRERLRGIAKRYADNIDDLGKEHPNDIAHEYHQELARQLGEQGYDSLKYRNISEHPDKGKADGTQAERAIEDRLRSEGDFSYMPLQRGTVKSATSGETLYAKAKGRGASNLVPATPGDHSPEMQQAFLRSREHYSIGRRDAPQMGRIKQAHALYQAGKITEDQLRRVVNAPWSEHADVFGGDSSAKITYQGRREAPISDTGFENLKRWLATGKMP